MLVTNEVNFQADGPDEMIFEVISGKDTPISITGSKEVDGEEIPEVKTYPIGVMQRAMLYRKRSEKGDDGGKN